jgi:hypothetical protein
MSLPKTQVIAHLQSLFDLECSYAPHGQITICLKGGEEWADYYGHHDNMGVSAEFRKAVEDAGWWTEWRNPEVIKLYPDEDFESKHTPDELINEWNLYIESINAPGDRVYWNNDDAFEELGLTIRQTLLAAKQDRYNWDHRFLTLDGYGNPLSSNDLDEVLDMDELEDWMYTVTK